MLESALSHIDGGFLEWDVLNNRLYMSTDGELKSIGISADKEKGNMRIIENFPDCIFDAIPVNCQERIRANLRNIYTCLLYTSGPVGPVAPVGPVTVTKSKSGEVPGIPTAPFLFARNRLPL